MTRTGRTALKLTTILTALVGLHALGCGEDSGGGSERAAGAPAQAAEPGPKPVYVEKVKYYAGKEPLSPEEERLVRRFHLLWVKRGEVFQNYFLGVRTLQNPLDVWVTQEIVSEVKPDFIVETGTYQGGSAALWAVWLEHINPEGRVITIDIEDQRSPKALELPITRRKVDFLLGSSTDPKLVADVARRVEGKKVVVILDSLHTEEHVLRELEAYGPMVGVGSYLIVQDTHTLKGPTGAIEQFLASSDHFEIDSSRERWMITNNAGGFLKRVR